MKLELMISLNGNCTEAINFYSEVFNTSILNILKYKDAPQHPEYPQNPDDAEKVMFANMNILDTNVMFCDMPSDMPFSSDGNINISISAKTSDEVTELFNKLSVGGTIIMPLAPTFFADMYAMFKDKFNVTWQIASLKPIN